MQQQMSRVSSLDVALQSLILYQSPIGLSVAQNNGSLSVALESLIQNLSSFCIVVVLVLVGCGCVFVVVLVLVKK